MRKLIIPVLLASLAACSPSDKSTGDGIISALTGGHDPVAAMNAAPFISSPVVVAAVEPVVALVVVPVVVEPPAPPVEVCVPRFRMPCPGDE